VTSDERAPLLGAGWKSNDINDTDSLSIAVPYCDGVFTDKAVRDKVISCRELDLPDRDAAEA
jgi:hypothetical protein